MTDNQTDGQRDKLTDRPHGEAKGKRKLSMYDDVREGLACFKVKTRELYSANKNPFPNSAHRGDDLVHGERGAGALTRSTYVPRARSSNSYLPCRKLGASGHSLFRGKTAQRD